MREDSQRDEAHLKDREKGRLNELQGVVQLITHVVDRLVVIKSLLLVDPNLSSG